MFSPDWILPIESEMQNWKKGALWLGNLYYHKSSIKPPPSNKPPFSGEESL